MDPLQRIAEAKISEAARRGAFEELPGAGQPLELDDLSGVSDDLRAGYILLKGAGFLPDELVLRKEMLRLSDLLDACDDPERAGALRRELDAKQLRYRILMEKRPGGRGLAEYEDAIANKLGRRTDCSRSD